MAKKVRDAMTAEPRTAEPMLSLAEAAQLMKGEDVGSLPIVEEGRLVAVLTDANKPFSTVRPNLRTPHARRFRPRPDVVPATRLQTRRPRR